MKTCPRCTTSVPFNAPVCTGCCLTFEAEAVPVAATPIAAAFVPPGTQAPDNPWREPAVETVYPEPYVEQPLAEIEEIAAPVAAVPAPPVYTPDPIGTSIPMPFADPLPPIAASAPQADYVAVALTSDAPAIPVAHTDDAATARGLGLPAEETLAVPAAYASFAPEPMAADTAEAPAEVVPLLPAGGVTIAPPAVHVPGWPEEDVQTASL